ncbi:MAG: 4-hydroxythreonine-4-phosphate dehydrogenase PdxA [Dysgonamonadaceae bacterium]|jgi:4-hydroxythreonine-4-phosphate dehydrogenase|nr:4-hydroxythreonine-4-phosphate dehydrogenase PdxA [Dysgonamonadaceae bacterium]
MSEKLIKVGISQGDMNGISYELVIKTFEDSQMFDFCIPVLYGSQKAWAHHRTMMELPAADINTIHRAEEAAVNRLNLVVCGDESLPVSSSQPEQQADAAAELAMQTALNDLKAGLIDVLLIAPSNADDLQILSEQSPAGEPLKILVYNSFRIALATGKIPLSDVPALLTVDLLFDKIKTLHNALINDFMINFPRIAVLSFNPGMGIRERKEGRIEKEIIIPAIKKADENKIICVGPYAGDEFFVAGEYMKFDATLALYHDQGSVSFRNISSCEGVCYYAGLPFTVVAPDIGVTYDKAGCNETSEAPFRNAIYLAIDTFGNKKFNRKIQENPLKKQYFERGSDNEKLDLTAD